MLDVAGRSVLRRQLEVLADSGFTRERIVVVTGFAAEALAMAHGREVRLLHNERWDTHNNLVSVHLLAQVIPDDLLLINGDTLFHPGVLTALLEVEHDAVLAIDDQVALAEEQMKVVVENGRVRRVSKQLDPASCQGESIGLLHFRGAALAALYAELGRMIAAGRTNEWYEGAIDRIAGAIDIRTSSTAGLPWTEIDTPEDLAQAERIARALDD
jgi:choline kinase